MPGTFTNLIRSVTNYSDLPTSGITNGTLFKVTSNNTYWVYNSATGLWLHPYVQPASLISDLDMSVLPTAASPAWTLNGNEDVAVASNELTITDNGTVAGNYAEYSLTDNTNFVSTNNIGLIAKVKVTAVGNLTRRSCNVFMCIRAGTLDIGAFGIAYCQALSAGEAVVMSKYSDSTIYGTQPTYSPNNAIYNIFYLYFETATERYRFGILGNTSDLYCANEETFDTSATAKTVYFGAGSSPQTSTSVWNYVKVFNF